MKIKLQTAKPRNPLVAAALMRRAGRHGGGSGRQRQAAGRALQRELLAMKPPCC
jgi:hypothetical protein